MDVGQPLKARKAVVMTTLNLNNRLDALEVRRICVIKPSALGDVVQSLPLLPVLRERFPAASIAWVINHELAELIEGHPLLHELLYFHRRGTAREYLALLQELRERQFDVVFDLQGLMRSGARAPSSWSAR